MKRLVVCVPGMNGATTSWNPLIERLRAEEAFRDADFLRFDHRCQWHSTEFAMSVCRRLLALVDAEWEFQKERGAPYEDICFLAHSMGALLVQHSYITALVGDRRHGLPSAEWAAAVSRIVLFAGISRGLCAKSDPDEEEPYKFRRQMLRKVIHFCGEFPVHLLAEDLVADSDFVTNIRLSWIRTFRTQSRLPTVVQVLGTEDRLINHRDSVDVEQFPQGHRVIIPDADHASVVSVEDDRGFNERRYALIRKAVLGSLEHSDPPPVSAASPSTIVFILHGIRASNTTWVKEAVSRLKERLPGVTAVPATYGYFSALNFLVPLVRRRRTRWFKETYSYYLSRNPAAEFHFIGHSNGTYLLGYSLKQLPDMRFNRVILAGSVLPKEFTWKSRIGTQVQQVWNHRSQLDVPVAILCPALRALGMKDVGTGGYEGFETVPEIHECCYHRGGHSAPVEEKQYLDALIHGVAGDGGESCQPLGGEVAWFSRLSHMSVILPYLVFISTLGLARLFGPLLARLIHAPAYGGYAAVIAVVALVIAAVLEYY